MEAMGGHELALDPEGFRRFEHRVGPQHIGSYELIRTQDRAIDMRFRGEVHDGIDMKPPEQRTDIIFLADITALEGIPRIAFEAGQVVYVSRVRQCVETDDLAGLRGCEPVSYEIGADEAGATGD